MPTCRDMSELVTDYLEQATPLRLRLSMWLHLLQCDACRHYFDQMRRTVRLLGSHPAQPSNPATEDGVISATRERRTGDTV